MEKRVLTEEIRRELLGLVPFSVNSTDEFTPPAYLKKADKNGAEEFIIPERFRPVFKVRCFTVEEKRAVTKMLLAIKDVPEEEVRECTRKVVVGWKNLFDAGTREEIAFKGAPDGGADPDLFAGIPASIAGFLLFHASKISGIIDPEKLGLR